jgi:dienelactone hydrolase
MIRSITLQTPHGPLHGQLDRPDSPRGLILLARAHHAPADTVIAADLASHGYAVFRMELLTAQEAQFVDATQNIPRLAQRLIDLLDLIRNDGDMQDLPLAIYATGDTTPAALRAAAQRDTQVAVLACHGGLIDRAGLQAINLLEAPLLMLFDADDEIGLKAAQRAASHLRARHELISLEPGEAPGNRIIEWIGQHTNTLRRPD